jgi:type IV secretory pathway TrbD component
VNWEAFVAVGSAVAVLGVLLLVPGLLSARRLARRDPRFDTRVTRFGLVLFGISGVRYFCC